MVACSCELLPRKLVAGRKTQRATKQKWLRRPAVIGCARHALLRSCICYALRASSPSRNSANLDLQFLGFGATEQFRSVDLGHAEQSPATAPKSSLGSHHRCGVFAVAHTSAELPVENLMPVRGSQILLRQSYQRDSEGSVHQRGGSSGSSPTTRRVHL